MIAGVGNEMRFFEIGGVRPVRAFATIARIATVIKIRVNRV